MSAELYRARIAKGAKAREQLDLARRVDTLESAKRALEREVVQFQRAAEMARGQSEMLIQSLNFLATESNLDKFLGHVLKVTVHL